MKPDNCILSSYCSCCITALTHSGKHYLSSSTYIISQMSTITSPCDWNRRENITPPIHRAWQVFLLWLQAMDGCGTVTIWTCDLPEIGWTLFCCAKWEHTNMTFMLSEEATIQSQGWSFLKNTMPFLIPLTKLAFHWKHAQIMWIMFSWSFNDHLWLLKDVFSQFQAKSWKELSRQRSCLIPICYVVSEDGIQSDPCNECEYIGQHHRSQSIPRTLFLLH